MGGVIGDCKNITLGCSFEQSAKEKNGGGIEERVEDCVSLTSARKRWHLSKNRSGDHLVSGSTKEELGMIPIV